MSKCRSIGPVLIAVEIVRLGFLQRLMQRRQVLLVFPECRFIPLGEGGVEWDAYLAPASG